LGPHTPAIVDACWIHIGRPGPGTCPELARHVLCRNCEVYGDAALRLLDRPAPDDYVREWTEHLAKPAEASAPANASAFVFRIGAEWFALPTAGIEQVTEASVVHSLPHRALPVRGLVSVRGELIVCVAMDSLLGLDHRSHPGGPSPAGRRLVVLRGDEGRTAFEPDEIHGVVRYDAGTLVAPPATLTRRAGGFLTARLLQWSGRSVGVLDAGRLHATLARSLS
jgi:chemotaxis-related protein WspD